MSPETAAMDVPKFPDLEPGITLLTSRGQTTGALHSLVLDHVLLTDRDAWWVDAKNNAKTTLFSQIAPSRRLLRRVHVARGFTAFQHYSAIEDLADVVTDSDSLVVLPAVDWFYESDDLVEGEGAAMLDEVLEILTELAAEREVPILLSRDNAAGVGECVEDYATVELECVETTFGPRFTGDEFETLLFDCDGGVQTTLAFWRRVLEQRAARLQQQPTGVSSRGTN